MTFVASFAVSVMAIGVVHAEDWPRFRGINGSGVSASTALPARFGPGENLVWKLAVGTGHSSPVVADGRIYLTSIEQEKLFTLCIEFETGKLLWKREAPRTRQEIFDKRNNAASPSPVVDGKDVYVFFPEFGLLSYTRDGKERWRFPMGPFDNFYGMGASPIIAGNNIVLVCDQTRGSFVIAIDKETGRPRWKRPRTEAVSGHSTPILHDGLIIAPGSFRMDAYDPRSGESIWWVYGLASEMKSVPISDGKTVFINGYNMPENDPGRQVAVPAFDEVLAKSDANKDGYLQKDELDDRTKKYFDYIDYDHDAKLSREDWRIYSASMAAENGLLAVDSSGKGDRTGNGIRWKFHRSIPQLPSTVLYDGILYMVNDGGILTTLDPATGSVHKQARLRTVPERIFSSPVAGDGKVYFVSQQCAVTVLKAGKEHEILAVNALESECSATPALVNNRILLRTREWLYAFGSR